MAINVFVPLPQLPHPKIHLAILLVIEEGLRKAWEQLRIAPPLNFKIASATEDEITQQFRLVVCNEVLKKGIVAGFTLDLFDVVREAKYENYSGDNTEKMPDLLVLIRGRTSVELPSEDGLFIECKPVDKKHPVDTTYCDKGIIRFTEGSYAWAMHQAMMISYVRTGYTIIPNLSDALKSRAQLNPPKKIETLHYPSSCPHSRLVVNLWCEPIHITCHLRSFSYHQTSQPAPEITIRHLWLKCD